MVVEAISLCRGRGRVSAPLSLQGLERRRILGRAAAVEDGVQTTSGASPAAIADGLELTLYQLMPVEELGHGRGVLGLVLAPLDDAITRVQVLDAIRRVQAQVRTHALAHEVELDVRREDQEHGLVAGCQVDGELLARSLVHQGTVRQPEVLQDTLRLVVVLAVSERPIGTVQAVRPQELQRTAAVVVVGLGCDSVFLLGHSETLLSLSG